MVTKRRAVGGQEKMFFKTSLCSTSKPQRNKNLHHEAAVAVGFANNKQEDLPQQGSLQLAATRSSHIWVKNPLRTAGRGWEESSRTFLSSQHGSFSLCKTYFNFHSL